MVYIMGNSMTFELTLKTLKKGRKKVMWRQNILIHGISEQTPEVRRFAETTLLKMFWRYRGAL